MQSPPVPSDDHPEIRTSARRAPPKTEPPVGLPHDVFGLLHDALAHLSRDAGPLGILQDILPEVVRDLHILLVPQNALHSKTGGDLSRREVLGTSLLEKSRRPPAMMCEGCYRRSALTRWSPRVHRGSNDSRRLRPPPFEKSARLSQQSLHHKISRNRESQDDEELRP
ncbi:MAG: hypothetical protein QOI57_1997 [Rubrobacteraceae bacterium]|nr:hypothetical protein [Rubrobacteraceae bacterium]